MSKPSGRTFTYELIIQVEVDEDNVDMPSANIWTFGEALAQQANDMTSFNWQADLVNARLLTSKEWSPEKTTAYQTIRKGHL